MTEAGVPPQVVLRSASALTAAFALAGTLALGIARLAYEDFYRQLGVTLDAVGLSNGRMLTFGVTVVLAVTGIVAVVVVPLMLILASPLRPPHRLVACAIALCLTSGLLVVTLNRLAESIFLLAALALVVPSSFAIAQPTWWGGALRRAAALTVCLVLVLTVFSAGAGAASAGRAFRISGDISVGSRLLDVSAAAVCVRDPQGRPLPEVPPDQLLLGTANGSHVLFRPGAAARATTVPVGVVVLTTRSRAAGC